MARNRTPYNPATLARLQKYRGHLMKEFLERADVQTKDIANIFNVSKSSVYQWKTGGGTTIANELGLAYLMGIPRSGLYPEDIDPHPTFIGRTMSYVTYDFMKLRTRILDAKGKTPYRIEDDKEEDWMVDAGLDVPFIRETFSATRLKQHPLGGKKTEEGLFGKVLKPKNPVEPNKIKFRDEQAEMPYTPGEPQVTHSVPVPEDPTTNQIKMFLHQAEKFRQNTGLEWFVDDNGRLRGRKVTTVEY